MLITSMSIFVSLFYMYVSVYYLHDVYHWFMVLHVRQCWLPPWCLSLYLGSTCMSALITSMMSIFVSWFYIYVSLDYLLGVYHNHMRIQEGQSCTLQFCLPLPQGATGETVFFTSMMYTITSFGYMCAVVLTSWCLSLHYRATCVSVVFTSLMSIITL